MQNNPRSETRYLSSLPDASCRRRNFDLHVHDAIAADDAFLTRLRHAFLDGRHEVAIHVLADEGLLELDSRVARLWLDAQPDLGELARAAGLFLVAIFESPLPRIVSRYFTRGSCNSTCTPNRRRNRSAMTSRCSSPWAERIVSMQLCHPRGA